MGKMKKRDSGMGRGGKSGGVGQMGGMGKMGGRGDGRRSGGMEGKGSIPEQLRIWTKVKLASNHWLKSTL